MHHGFNQVANIVRNLVALFKNMIVQYINELTVLVNSFKIVRKKYIWLWKGIPVMKEFYLKSLKTSCCSLYVEKVLENVIVKSFGELKLGGWAIILNQSSLTAVTAFSECHQLHPLINSTEDVTLQSGLHCGLAIYDL